MPKPKGTILVVDDNQPVREWVADTLADAGYAVLHAGDGKEAEPLAGTADAIFLDLEMPGMSGEELIQRLRRRGHLVPIVVFTAWEDRARAVLRDPEAGVHRVVIKPGDVNQLLFRAEEAIEESRKIDYLGAASTCIREFVDRSTRRHIRPQARPT